MIWGDSLQTRLILTVPLANKKGCDVSNVQESLRKSFEISLFQLLLFFLQGKRITFVIWYGQKNALGFYICVPILSIQFEELDKLQARSQLSAQLQNVP